MTNKIETESTYDSDVKAIGVAIEMHKNLKHLQDFIGRFPMVWKYLNSKARPDQVIEIDIKPQRVSFKVERKETIYDLSDIGLLEEGLKVKKSKDWFNSDVSIKDENKTRKQK